MRARAHCNSNDPRGLVEVESYVNTENALCWRLPWFVLLTRTAFLGGEGVVDIVVSSVPFFLSAYIVSLDLL